MAGRRPKPTRLKELEGNPGKRPLNKREPQFRVGRPHCPQHLGTVARREWHRIVGELHRVGLLTLADRAALAAYCQLYDRWAAAEQEIAKTGLTLTTSNGNVIQNPVVGIANTALDGMRKYLVEFGLTPASRAKLQTAAPEKPKTLDDELRALLSGTPLLEEEAHAGSN